MEGNFSAMATRNISKFPVSNNLFRVTVWRRGGDQQFRISDCESRIEFEEGLDGELNANPLFEFRNPQFHGDQQFRISDCESRIEFEEGLDGELSTNPLFEFRNPQFHGDQQFSDFGLRIAD
jgi:hypothetical protein